ncbi:hypothetical protein V0288_21640 [Pannus brasiliensis CCIBt3594]|uniref:Uncharacterized protein n=1 Tax=Pannus brasiliensis CCIBt3594 TaxID=1427578 RepID=A0AAW9R0N6_9CHRO
MNKYEYSNLCNLPSVHPVYDHEFNQLIEASFLLCQQTLYEGDLGRAKFMNWLDRLYILHLLIKLRFDESYAVPFSQKTIKLYDKIAQLYHLVFLGCELFFQDASISSLKTIVMPQIGLLKFSWKKLLRENFRRQKKKLLTK